MPTIDLADESAFEPLHDRLRGSLVRPTDEDYDDARAVWNGMVDKYPAAIARCAGAADVMAAVDFAREHDLLLSVRGGGHNVAGKAVCDDGLVIDCSPMDFVRVDPDGKTARVGPGATWADFDHEAQAFGLATTGGVDSRTGVAGLTLGGGVGWLARSHGLACDNLVGADVVTAGGDLVHASADENPALFWGLRGGGGNFGVVTAFEFELHDVGPEVLVAQAFYPTEHAEAVLRFYRDYAAEAPDAVAPYALVANVPPEAPFPEEHHGEAAVVLVAPYAGDPEAGRRHLEPIAEADVGEPILRFVDTMPYAALQQSFDDGTPAGERYYYRAMHVSELPDEAIETIATHARELPAPFTMAGIEPMGGAVNAVADASTAYPHRDAAFSFGIWAGWSDPERDDELIEWTRAFHEAMTPYSTGGVYANYLDRDEDDRIRAAYGDNYDRLVELKDEWDPENRFRLNSNVEPTV